jgi:HEAT repeat protein
LRKLDIVPQKLDALLDDPHALVRAEAIHFVVQTPTPERLEAMVRELFRPQSLARFNCQNLFAELGSEGVECLRGLLQQPPGAAEVALETAASVADMAFLETALRYAQSPRASERSAAATLLGSIGEAEAVDRLQILLGDADPTVARAAARGLGRSRDWRAAPRLAEVVQQEQANWSVRLQASRALRKFGAPGELFLQDLTRSDSPTTASLARGALQRVGL